MLVLTGKQFRELDAYTIEHEPIASVDLMERAARALTERVAKRWSAPREIYIFAGPGGNGGDGLAMARMLSQLGYEVSAWLFNTKGHLNPDCEINKQRLADLPQVRFTEVSQGFDFPHIPQEAVVIDALFGTGLNSPLSGGFAQLVQKINALSSSIVSIDVPSGLMCEDNGQNDPSAVVQATLTLSIQVPKLAFLLPDMGEKAGEWELVDIGLSAECLKRMPTPYSIMSQEQLRLLLRTRPVFAHKGTMGRALLVGGSRGMAGAMVLASKACLRGGVGKVSVLTSEASHSVLQIAVPEAVLSLASNLNDDMPTTPPDLSPFNAVGIGPGLGTTEAAASLLRACLSRSKRPMVIDADALNLIASHSELLHLIPRDSILTPHPKELERIVGTCGSAYERLALAMGLAARLHVHVVLKGHFTAVCDPMGTVRFCPTGNSGMATAGSGDVLTGIITSLLAQGYPPADAAQLGTWLHGMAGDCAARHLEAECMVAGDIVSHLPEAFRNLKNKETLKI